MSASRPAAIARQPASCGGVGAAKRARNHSATSGSNPMSCMRGVHPTSASGHAHLAARSPGASRRALSTACLNASAREDGGDRAQQMSSQKVIAKRRAGMRGQISVYGRVGSTGRSLYESRTARSMLRCTDMRQSFARIAPAHVIPSAYPWAQTPLAALAGELAAISERDEVVPAVLRAAVRLLHAEVAALSLYDAHGRPPP